MSTATSNFLRCPWHETRDNLYHKRQALKSRIQENQAVKCHLIQRGYVKQFTRREFLEGHHSMSSRSGDHG